jgi:hypothetical protein
MLHPCRARAALRFLSFFLVGALPAVLSCNSTEDPNWTFPLHDQLGRHCEYQCDVTDCALACDPPEQDAGVACATGTDACLTVATATDPRLGGVAFADPAADLVCAGCCDRTGVLGGLTDCSPIACSTDNDCYADGYSCRSGYCACTDSSRCPTGMPDGGSAPAADANADEAARD